ncbi:histidine kinase [Prolixibacteraceae bacterium JC049]|nr:histidine kinase [Prolixibacteraceae bacterium JC049]
MGKENRIFEHLLAWFGLIVLRLLALPNVDSLKEALLTTLPLYLIYMIIFYGTAAIQKQFVPQKYWWYILKMLLMAFASTALIRFTFNAIELFMQVKAPVGTTYGGVFRVLFVMIVAMLYQVILNKRSTEERALRIMHEKTEKELEFLKSQMNPHFFFNTLNNIYGLTYNKDERAPKVVLMLSEAMRYIIYETSSEQVALTKEIAFISNYIELERLRLLNGNQINLEVEVPDRTSKVAPLLMLPFVENCFKHGNIDQHEQASIEINIWTEGEWLQFSCANTFSDGQGGRPGGVGLQNVKKRLDLIYGDRYKLEINNEEDKYFVFLSVPLSK